jgi:hypothetical protein
MTKLKDAEMPDLVIAFMIVGGAIAMVFERTALAIVLLGALMAALRGWLM